MTLDVPMQVESLDSAGQRADLTGWQAPRTQRLHYLLAVAVAHGALFAVLWRSVVERAPASVVPVTLQMVVAEAELVKPPAPQPRRTAVPRRANRPIEQTVEPEVPVVASPNVAASIPASPAAQLPATSARSPDLAPALANIRLPSSTADYLSNPAPAYPPRSKRLQEQGRVLLYVLVDAQGMPLSIEIKSGSGFSRLDEAAVDAVQRWKFVPGTRNGVPERMWVEVPIEFRLRS